MATVLLCIGILIVVATIVLLVKGVETRVVLLAAGFLMAIIAGNPLAAFNAFSARMVFGGLIEPILSVMGFAYVMKLTTCDAHLINLLASGLKRVRIILIPGACLATAFVNVSLTSAAGVSAAVGAILIPMLIASGVRPALAAAAVFGGTFGSALSPGNAHNVFIASKLVNQPVMEVVNVMFFPTLMAVLISAIGLMIVGIVTKENRGYVAEAGETPVIEHANLFYAMIPILPVVVLMLGASSLGAEYAWLKKIRISHAMLAGAFLGIVVTRTNPTAAVREFFRGTGDVYASVFGIIISASVFVGGLEATGVVGAFNEMLKSAGDAARWAAAFGPFILAIITGSGDAATLAFNEAVSPHAAQYGMTVMNMGCLANLAGALGRTMSPLTGAIIVCAGIANVPTMEIAKRTAPAMIVAIFVTLFLFS
jgi:DcuC family C4-dicarboxylate transporter